MSIQMPELTEKQAKAMPEIVAEALRHEAEVPEDIDRWDYVTWQDEIRPGRGHFVSAIHFSDSRMTQVLMDVYGYPNISVSYVEPIHNSADDECSCDQCEEDRDIECDLCNPFRQETRKEVHDDDTI